MPGPLTVPVASAALSTAKSLPVVGGAVGKVASVFAGSDAEKDAARDAALGVAYNKAVAGDVNSALFIRQRTGRYAGVNVPGYGEVSSGGSDHSQRIARETWVKVKALPNGVAAKAEALYVSLRSGGAVPGSPQAVVASLTSYKLFGVPAWLVAVVVVGVAVVLWRRR